MPTKAVWLGWELNSKSGWGILGLNLFFQWATRADITPIMAYAINNEALWLVDPLRLSAVSKAIAFSNNFANVVAKTPGPRVDFDGTVIDGISQPDRPSRIFGRRNIGRCIFDNANIANFERHLDKYDALLCGSNWNADIIREQTGRAVKVIFEGIDPSLFCPGPRSGVMDEDKFYIFSGGKVEPRKGQDLVLRAFKEFSKRRDNAVLVTAWHSPWPKFSVGFKGTLDSPLTLDDKGFVNIKKWVTDNGIEPSRVVEIYSTPNQLMPTLLREMHVALQPSRAESCTNLPAMEAMACGVPVIVGDNTGMKDLITEDNCVRLCNQGVVPQTSPDYSTAGWGESSVDEIVEALEMLYADQHRREAIGATGARWIREHRTWQRHAAQLKDFVLSLD
ncbi:MAG TPA: glycosyltransferase family 4 protein [Casimicrobiaceae bacterium]|jgi:glycosyltransferase involved in cell wall biosynthesis|nr:glycosyltransferase family 4 protein [Casimicrobiaceae bacterium]